ncbi:uncharacterized protein OCT59_023385 [Rhizophagus irregularis]|uniref:Uncharacterized protein n=1 Tax=Rhizophagus irregularis (strain DAOM 181602 / DAOM 197198 / MUCL 43194) TaxID=747089 RepID=A0A2H5RQE0_RHIID|nr:hypothetical protein GLOIN_2v1476526 [Rhizophagus irregularis DAOM 181602=DAOM 197198]POG74060.1 hypothetical protein GLOIN_2v1476526 [Rhizophagus irregularis DAOM 181602=DAOM 197198]UZO02972.1 hypothetical protein OCT59_023385 [Rhizophagus irregularis]GBC20301.1 hypothetical protein GLOIN_2v1476526 [Rhizophagus irregularis DAOM 181602=DAOM 197198]|eukprot:XP_025180926.1 hypothetical protein GLOIN_2v1476526 [Rhizophagus irregularis DAOM 181602=DAOM 197198]
MEPVLPNDSILSAEYETLGLIDNDNSNGSVIDNEDDEVWDDGDEDDSDDDHDILGIRDGHDYIACYGRDAWDKLIQAQEARHRISFLGYLPNAFQIFLSKQRMDYLIYLPNHLLLE